VFEKRLLPQTTDTAIDGLNKDLRFYSKNLLDVVSRGEEVIITYRGKPCAKLAPLNEADKNDLV
jgi:prevent-host-death family protein